MTAPITLKDLARRLGLSPATVSKALNGRPDINENTRKKVQAAASRLKYRPDPAGQRLRRQSSDAIGFVLSAPQSHFANPFFLDMLQGINEALEGSRYQVIITSARSLDHELECFRWLVEEQRVDGLLFGRTRRHDPRIHYLLGRKVPFVSFGRSEAIAPFAWIDIDHSAVGRDGCARFIALGHRRIALINTPEQFMFSLHHSQGYRAALRAAGLPYDPALHVADDISEHGGAAAAHRLLDLPQPPNAIVCGHDLMAIGAMRAAAERGLVPGRDIGVIGADNHPIGPLMNPPLTTFSAETYAAGKRMVQMFLELVAGTPPQDLQELWRPELIVRSSDGRRREPASRIKTTLPKGRTRPSRPTRTTRPTPPLHSGKVPQ
jgi:LacI family transcriptional regulator